MNLREQVDINNKGPIRFIRSIVSLDESSDFFVPIRSGKMRKVLLLLGIICIFVLSGCGKSDGISGTWVPKQQEGTGISSIVLEKENDFTYKGVVNYTDGKKISSMYKYDKTYNSIEEDPSEVIKKKKEYNIYGRIVLNFDDKHTIAHMGQSVQPEDTFIKK